MGILFSLFSFHTGSSDSVTIEEEAKDALCTKKDSASLPPVTAADVMVVNLKHEQVLRLPLTIRGNEFVIDNCEGCDILVCDRTAQVTIDNCRNCRLFIAPCEASVFLRDCYDCKVVVACQQLRFAFI